LLSGQSGFDGERRFGVVIAEGGRGFKINQTRNRKLQTKDNPIAMNSSIDTPADTSTLDSLLRGELSAIETYSQAIHKFPDAAFRDDLHSIRAEHQNNVGILRRLISGNDGDPPTSSGAWGTFAKAVEGTAAALSEGLALKALKEGEEHGISEYEEALEKEDGLDSQARAAIQGELLPSLREHVRTLEALIGRC
jgi:rubrerythrin